MFLLAAALHHPPATLGACSPQPCMPQMLLETSERSGLAASFNGPKRVTRHLCLSVCTWGCGLPQHRAFQGTDLKKHTSQAAWKGSAPRLFHWALADTPTLLAESSHPAWLSPSPAPAAFKGCPHRDQAPVRPSEPSP